MKKKILNKLENAIDKVWNDTYAVLVIRYAFKVIYDGVRNIVKA